jgi:hypothetical protein
VSGLKISCLSEICVSPHSTASFGPITSQCSN